MIFVKLRRVNNNEVYLTALNGDFGLTSSKQISTHCQHKEKLKSERFN